MCWNWDGIDAESISMPVLFETQRKDAKVEREKKEEEKTHVEDRLYRNNISS
jgi:hypothetical protein